MGKYSNRFIYCFEQALLEKLGANGRNSLKGLASVFEYWNDLPPLDDLRITKSEYVGKICQACLDMYGPKGSKEIQQLIGEGTFSEVMQHFYPLNIVSLSAASLLLSQLEPLLEPFEAQPIIVAKDDRLVCSLKNCPNCLPTKNHDYFIKSYNVSHICDFVRGYIKAAVEQIAPGRQITVEETACRVLGEGECVFEISWT